VAFVGVRSVIAPPIVAWFVYSLWFRSTLIPTTWRVVMGSCVSLGMVASQVGSAKGIERAVMWLGSCCACTPGPDTQSLL